MHDIFVNSQICRFEVQKRLFVVPFRAINYNFKDQRILLCLNPVLWHRFIVMYTCILEVTVEIQHGAHWGIPDHTWSFSAKSHAIYSLAK